MRTPLRLGLVGLAAALAVSFAVSAPAQANDRAQAQTKSSILDTFKQNVAVHAHHPATSRAGTLAEAGTATVLRLAGPDRIATAIAASQVWDDAGGEFTARAVVLSRYDEYADALGGSALAGAAVGPLLITRTAALDPSVETEIARLLGDTGTVYLLGGEGALSKAVADRLTVLGYTVERLGGADRYETSVGIATKVAALSPEGTEAFSMVATGMNFPDGLTAGATAAAGYGSVLLIRDSEIPASVQAYLDELIAKQVPLVAVGDQAAGAAEQWDVELAGPDRYATAAEIAEFFWASPEGPDPVAIGLATGLNWPDALAGGAHIAGLGPMVLAWGDTLTQPTATAITHMVDKVTPSSVTHGFIYGGEDVVSLTAESAFTALLP